MSWADVKPEHRQLANRILTTKQLRVVQHRMDGHSWNTIALALGMSRSNARQHYKAALEKLRAHMEEAA